VAARAGVGALELFFPTVPIKSRLSRAVWMLNKEDVDPIM
jgi:hypothetical protein